MAFDKLIDALNEFRGEYVRELTNSLTEKNLISSGQLGESIKLDVQPKVKLFGQIYRMQIRMAEYGENVDKGRAPGKGLPVGVLEEWLKYPNTLQKVTGQDKQLSDYERKSLAFVINRSIKQKGIKPKNWIQPAFDKVTPKIAGVVEAAIADDIELTFEEIKKLIETK
jgi:hypothetical protein